MENEKYYVPSIEEFHVGFEFEHKLKDSFEWKKEILEYPNNLGFLFGYIVPKSDVRVKYLNKEDIESFGFKKHEKLWYKFEKDRFALIILESKRDAEINFIQIEDKMYDNESIFKSRIKNKSELKILLKQLDI